MIYIHSYRVCKSGDEQIRNVHDTYDEALAQQRALGGVIQDFESVEDVATDKYQIENVLISEVSELIDNMTIHGPGSPWEKPGSPAWYAAKIETINLFANILNGNFDEIE
ncbi:hypothetical protein CSP48_004032 [Salmonella enterica subsp. arizonae]|nr:hypothetical protein [Salmonella enterica subsp. arizonae]